MQENIRRGARRIAGRVVPEGWWQGIYRRTGRTSWYVCIFRKRRKASPWITKAFCDAEFGSPWHSLRAAHSWRLKMESRYLSNHRGTRPTRDRGNVYIRKGWARSGGGRYHWMERAEARLNYRGKQYCRSHSILKYGEAEAVERAWNSLDELIADFLPPDPSPKHGLGRPAHMGRDHVG